jgi:hypothetical protein
MAFYIIYVYYSVLFDKSENYKKCFRIFHKSGEFKILETISYMQSSTDLTSKISISQK